MGLEHRILFVSDRKAGGSARDLNLNLQPANIVIETDLEQLLECFEHETPDLLILDVGLDNSEVIDLIGNLRPQMYIPILLLTSEPSEEFLLDAYDAGVDDCVIKPVNPALLQAKASVWLRRSWSAGPGAYEAMKVGQMQLLPAEKTVIIEDQKPVRLTNLELRLLHNLMSNVGHVITVEELNEKVWGYSGEVDNTLIKNVVYRLRRKIEPDPARPSLIETVTGVGYRLTAV